MHNIDEQKHHHATTHAIDQESKHEIDFVQLALRYRWLLLAGLVAGIVLGEAGYRQLGPEYEAVTKVLVSKKVSVPVGAAETQTFGERGQHITLIMSPMIVGNAVEKHGLDKLPSLAGYPDPVEEILDALIVKRSAGEDRSFLNVLEINYRNRYRADARKVVEGIVDAYQSYLNETKKEHVNEILEQTSEANSKLLQDLRATEQAYLEFREHAPMQWRTPSSAPGQLGQTTNVHQERMKALEIQRREYIIKRTEIEARIETLEQAAAKGDSREKLEDMVRLFVSLENGAAASATKLATPPEQLALDTQLIPLILEEKKLLRDFGGDHPDVIAVRKSIQTLLDFYRLKGIRLPEVALNANTEAIDFVALYLRSLQQTVVELTRREEAITDLYEREDANARKMAGFQLQDQALVDEIQRKKKLWETLVDGFGKMQLSKESSGFSMKQIAPVRSELVFKRHLKFLAAGMFVGLMSMLGVAYLRTLQDSTLRTLDDLRNHISLPLLGAVPEFEPAVASEVAASQAPNLSGRLCYFHRPGSVEAESYRSVRTALLVSAQSQSAKVVQVTSPTLGDGKSTFVANLALALAQSDKKVLLIDADLRRPTAHELLGLRMEMGLSDVLAGDVEFNTAVQATNVTGLSLLSAGALPDNPSERLSSKRFSALLAAARNEYDIVLVDSPPLLAVSDPCVIARETDGLMLVVRLNKVNVHVAERAIELLDTHGVNVLGVIANGVEFDSDDYGVGYGVYSRYLPGHQVGRSSKTEANPDRDVPLPV